MSKKKLRLAVLKELERDNKKFNQEDLGISKVEFEKLFRDLENEGFVRNVDYYYDSEVDVKSAEITLKGEEYLEQNSTLTKTYKGLKELRDWFKL